LKVRLQATAFKESTKGILDQLKLYSLEWCKILIYPSIYTLGGWVAENFLGFIRISTLFYSLINHLKQANPDEVNLEGPPTTRKMKQKRFWLVIRGLLPTNGNALQLKERVQVYHEMDPEPPI
jgi:hypothetical protein